MTRATCCFLGCLHFVKWCNGRWYCCANFILPSGCPVIWDRWVCTTFLQFTTWLYFIVLPNCTSLYIVPLETVGSSWAYGCHHTVTLSPNVPIHCLMPFCWLCGYTSKATTATVWNSQQSYCEENRREIDIANSFCFQI